MRKWWKASGIRFASAVNSFHTSMQPRLNVTGSFFLAFKSNTISFIAAVLSKLTRVTLRTWRVPTATFQHTFTHWNRPRLGILFSTFSFMTNQQKVHQNLIWYSPCCSVIWHTWLMHAKQLSRHLLLHKLYCWSSKGMKKRRLHCLVVQQ